MASTDAKPVPQKGVAYRVTVPIFDADGDLVSGASGLDSEVSKDGGAFADCTSEATEIGSSGMYYLDLTSTEMNADTVAGIIKTTTSGAKTTVFVLYPEETGDIRANATAMGGTTLTARDIGASVLLSSGTGTGQLDFTSGVVKANVTQFGGSAGTFSSGRPEVNTTHAAGTAWGSGAITAGSIAAAALDGKGDWNVGKTGYTLSQAFPTNFSSLAITVGGAVTAGTVSDKTGYSLTQSFPSNFASLGINASGHVSRVTLVDTTTSNSDMRGTDNAALASVWTSTRGGYIDNLSAGAVATAANLVTVTEYLDTEIAAILENTGTTIPAQISALSIPAASTVAFAVRTELGTELGRLDVAVSTRGTGANQSTIITHLTDIKGATFSGSTDSLEAIRDRGDSAWATATAVTVSDKTGFKLASDGLDSIATTAPSGVASNFREMIVQVWRYFFKKTTKDDNSNNIKTYADNGSTVLTTQTTSDTGGVQTRGAAS